MRIYSPCFSTKGGYFMKAFSVEHSLLEGEKEVKDLFAFVNAQAHDATAYEIEQTIFTRVMRIGLTALQCYFAQKGTGDIGEEVTLADGLTLPRETALHPRTYFSVFGKLSVPRT